MRLQRGVMRPFLILPLVIAALVFAVWSWFDYRIARQNFVERLRADTLVRAEVLNGNVDKHRQGAVLLARHPAIMAIAQTGVREDRQSELQRLVAITDVDGASVHSLNGDIWAATPVHFLNALDGALYNSPAWKMAVQGSLGRLWRNNRYYFLAPVFVNGRVGAVAVSHFSMDEATAQLRLSNHELWITDGSGRVLFSNNEQRGQHSPDTSVFLPELHAQIWVKPTGPVPFSSWGARAGVASLVTFALTSLITLLLARRRLLAAENQRRRRQNETLEQRVEQRTQELVQAQDALVQSGKLALLGQVTASIAHEINQPLGAIHNYAENSVRLLDAGKQEAAVRNQRKISEQAQRTARIVENLRAFSKRDRQGVQVVHVQDAIQAVLTAVSDRFAPLKDAVDTRWLVDVEALAGRVRLEQILMNLIINAWKEIEACEDQQIWIGSDAVSDNALAIWVEDSGRGIEGLTEQELFEPFVTTRAQIDGLGLGLAIAKQFAETMGGDLRLARTQHLSGARFEIQLLKNTAANRKKLNV